MNFRKAVAPKFEKIREVIVSEKFDPVESFKRALLYPAEGHHYNIPLANLRIMASTMVEFIREADTISIGEIKNIHKSVKIIEAGLREVPRVFLLTCSPNEAFRKKANVAELGEANGNAARRGADFCIPTNRAVLWRESKVTTYCCEKTLKF